MNVVILVIFYGIIENFHVPCKFGKIVLLPVNQILNRLQTLQTILILLLFKFI